MSKRTMTVADAARHFSEVIRRAERNGSTVITRNGAPVAVVSPARDRAADKSTKAPKRFPFVACLKGNCETDVTRVDDYLYGEKR
jgi:prevent-host-death family protein